MAVSLYRPSAVAHRYETGWARARHRSRFFGWAVVSIVLVNAIAFAAIFLMVR